MKSTQSMGAGCAEPSKRVWKRFRTERDDPERSRVDRATRSEALSPIQLERTMPGARTRGAADVREYHRSLVNSQQYLAIPMQKKISSSDDHRIH